MICLSSQHDIFYVSSNITIRRFWIQFYTSSRQVANERIYSAVLFNPSINRKEMNSKRISVDVNVTTWVGIWTRQAYPILSANNNCALRNSICDKKNHISLSAVAESLFSHIGKKRILSLKSLSMSMSPTLFRRMHFLAIPHSIAPFTQSTMTVAFLV